MLAQSIFNDAIGRTKCNKPPTKSPAVQFVYCTWCRTRARPGLNASERMQSARKTAYQVSARGDRGHGIMEEHNEHNRPSENGQPRTTKAHQMAPNTMLHVMFGVFRCNRIET